MLLLTLFLLATAAPPPIRIGFTNPSTGGFASIAIPCQQAFEMWVENQNARGGIELAGESRLIELITVDVGGASNSAMIASTKAVVREMCNKTGLYGPIDILLGPYSSTLAPVAIAESTKCDLVTIIAGAAGTDILRCVANSTGGLPAGCTQEGERRYYNSLSILGNALSYLGGFVNLMKIKQAKSAVVFYEDAAFTEEVGRGAAALAKSLRINVTGYVKIPRTTTVAATSNWSTTLVNTFKRLAPDVILGGTYQEACYGFVQELKRQLYTPPGAALSVCVSPNMPNDIGDASEWVMGSSGWDHRLKGQGFDETTSQRSAHFLRNANKTSCQQFNDAFINRTGKEPIYQAVSYYVAGYVINELLLLSQTTDSAELLKKLLNVYIPATIYGPVVFDSVGANVGKEFITLQVVPTRVLDIEVSSFDASGNPISRKRQTTNVSNEYVVNIVTPLSTAEVDAYYPAPLWAERVWNYTYASLPAESVIIAVTSFLIFCSLVLIVVLFIWRKKPQIMAASFIYCCVMVIGGIIAYISMYFWVMNTNTVFCNLIPWFICLGFDIMTGALLAKNWRLYVIFSNAMKLRAAKPISNLQLALPLLCLCILDACLIIIWEAAFPIHATVVIVDPLRPSENYFRCLSENYTAWQAFIGLLGALKAVVILFGIWLAIVCRKQPSEFNEAKYIAYALYNQLFCLCILLAIWQAIPVESYELAYILRSFVFLWAITITLLSIFVQKIYFTIRGKKDPTKGVSGLATKGSVVTAYTTTTPSSLDGTSTPTVNYKTPAQSSTVN